MQRILHIQKLKGIYWRWSSILFSCSYITLFRHRENSTSFWNFWLVVSSLHSWKKKVCFWKIKQGKLTALLSINSSHLHNQCFHVAHTLVFTYQKSSWRSVTFIKWASCIEILSQKTSFWILKGTSSWLTLDFRKNALIRTWRTHFAELLSICKVVYSWIQVISPKSLTRFDILGFQT